MCINMFLTFLIVIVFGLLGVIVSQIIYIHQLKKRHFESLNELSRKLMSVQAHVGKNNAKIIVEENFKSSLKVTQEKLNSDLFDLQMSVFGERFEKRS